MDRLGSGARPISTGRSPSRGRENVDRRYPGFLHSPRMGQHGPMYGHGFATLFLSEVCGMVQTPKLRDDLRGTLERAVKLILTAQKRSMEGAWRYNPDSRDADTRDIPLLKSLRR